MEPHEESVAPIHKWLKKSGHLVYSTDQSFAKEVGSKAKIKLASYVQAGCASSISSNCFEELENNLRNNPQVKSDDHHILALALHTRTRVLFTGDSKLIKDFTNPNLFKPKGKIYSDQRQANLLTDSVCPKRA